MEGSTGFRKFAYRWLIRQHYKRRILIRLCPKRTLERKFYQKLGYWPDLENPKTFNEKLSWFKLCVRDPRITTYVDKYAVREYVAEKVGGVYLVPLLNVYESVEQIDIAQLPKQFVLKPNHESGRIIICHDKDKMNWRKKADVMRNWLRENYYYQTGEWQYKNIPPKILCEQLLPGDIIDYRFYCFKGVPVIVRATYDAAHTERKANFNLDFQVIPDKNNQNRPDIWMLFQKPQQWGEMISIAKTLSAGFPFVRVDLYDVEGRVYFGELTFTPADGMEPFWSREWEEKLGELYDRKAFDSRYVQPL